jgi:murein DD-endopeptidase MepM/ murein hydrolase activator NlpD
MSLSLAACTRIGGPAPVVAYGAHGSSVPPVQNHPVLTPAPSPPQPVSSVPGEVIVQPGDTLYSVARRSAAPMRSIIDANNLQPPYVLRNGQHLIVPSVRSYQVQPGDTVSSVARRFGLGTTELVRANSLPPPYNLRTGQLIVLPPGPPVSNVVVAAPALPATSPVVRDEMPLLPQASSASRGGIETAALPPPPPPPAAPAPAGVVVVGPPPPAPAPRPRHQPHAVPPPPGPPPSSVAAVTPLPPPPAPQESQPASVSPRAPVEPPPAPAEIEPGRGGRFLWPVRGAVVSDFGSKPGGLQNDGINIAAPRGTAIRAAEAGVVVYAGNELRGFGNLLLVKHRDGWVTAYAHAEELLVRRGEQVKRGQVIAKVGATGNVSSPQLHFEVRKGSRPLNPRDYLGPQTASASP